MTCAGIKSDSCFRLLSHNRNSICNNLFAGSISYYASILFTVARILYFYRERRCSSTTGALIRPSIAAFLQLPLIGYIVSLGFYCKFRRLTYITFKIGGLLGYCQVYMFLLNMQGYRISSYCISLIISNDTLIYFSVTSFFDLYFKGIGRCSTGVLIRPSIALFQLPLVCKAITLGCNCKLGVFTNRSCIVSRLSNNCQLLFRFSDM